MKITIELNKPSKQTLSKAVKAGIGKATVASDKVKDKTAGSKAKWAHFITDAKAEARKQAFLESIKEEE